jgi:hypothetical protein
VLGAVLFKAHGVLAELGGTILGGIAGLGVSLNAFRMIEVIIIESWRIIRRPPAQKEADHVPKQKGDAKR